MPMKKGKRLLPLAVLLVFLLALAVLVPGLQRNIRENSREAIRNTVLRCAVECYAVEGAYPPYLQYLREHYGLRYNQNRYAVFYDVFVSNLMPEIQVVARSGR